MRTLRTIAALIGSSLLLGGASAPATTLQPVGKFAKPIYLTSAPANPDRLFVVERLGTIKLSQNGTVSTFADISSAVQCGTGCAGERGLLSIALAPDFAASGRLYVDYANSKDGTIHVAELRASGSTAPIGTLRDVLAIPHGEKGNHNGGQLQFGPDGYLYVSTGDGGGEDDELRNAQDLGSLLGKILRIDPRQSGAQPYTVPDGSPFDASPAPYDTIWSYGLRNPFRFSFDRLTGDLTIGDVGQGAREEIDHAPAPLLGAGANYGWSCREGLLPGPAEDPSCAESDPTSFVAPAFDYPRTAPAGDAQGCAIIGGYVVRDPGLGDLYGRYLYGDLCTGEIRSLELDDPGSDRGENLTVAGLNSFGEDSCGRLYTVAGSGQVSRLVGAAPTSCFPPAPNPPATPGLPPDPARTLAPAYVGLRAVSKKVERGKRAMLTAWVSPCTGRKGEAVRLYRGVELVGARRLDRACTVRFNPRIRQPAGFQARVLADDTFLSAQSRRLRIRIDK